MRKFIEYLKNEEGQTSIEYIMLLVVAALIVMKFKKTATERISGLTDTIFGELDKAAADLSVE